MKGTIALITLLSSLQLLACQVETYTRIVKINKHLNHSIFKSSSCSNRVESIIQKTLSSMDGKIRTGLLTEIIQTEHAEKVKFKNSNLLISNLNKELRKEFSNNDFIIKDLNTISGLNSINADINDGLQVFCRNCQNGGMKTIRVKLGDTSIWVNAKFLFATYSYILKEDFYSFNQSIPESKIVKVKSYVETRDNVFRDLKNLKYYKLNKRLSKGHVLKVNDLVPITVIKRGQIVHLNLNNKNIKLKTKALAKQSGHIGQIIQLTNINSKKTIYGKITDFNEAIIQL